MRNWNDFLQEFVLQAMTRAEVTSASDEDYYLRVSIRMAREAWDAIQAAEIPDSEKAKQAYLYDLRALSIEGLRLSNKEAKWIAIDSNGEVWAYTSRPGCITTKGIWSNIRAGGLRWGVKQVAPPCDFTKEIYEISKILSND